MPKLAANISMMFTEHDLLDRIDAAAAVGFGGVECQFPYRVPAAEFAARLRARGVGCVLINTPPGSAARRITDLPQCRDAEVEFMEEPRARACTMPTRDRLHPHPYLGGTRGARSGQ